MKLKGKKTNKAIAASWTRGEEDLEQDNRSKVRGRKKNDIKNS